MAPTPDKLENLQAQIREAADARPDLVLAQRLERDFTYHPPDLERAQRHRAVRDVGRQLAEKIVACAPDCRERSLALTKVEEAVMWANAGIAREPPVHEPQWSPEDLARWEEQDQAGGVDAPGPD